MKDINQNSEEKKKKEKQLKEHYTIRERSKNSVFRIVFGRTFFLMFAVIVQLLFYIVFIFKLSKYNVYFFSVCSIFSILLTIRVTSKDINASYKLAWTTLLLAIPVFGALFYVLLKIHPSTGLIRKRHIEICKKTKCYIPQNMSVLEELKEKKDDFYGLARYVDTYGGYPTYKNTSVKYFRLGDYKYEALLEELEKAKSFIFMEYYIVDEGVMWNSVLEILKRKAKEGVEVRFMYDGMCTLKLLPHDYPKTLESYGIKCKVFSNIRPAISSYQNNRDHRKICVIDGQVAFTGGVNLSDEYINIGSKFGHWKDTAVMIKGEAVRNFTVMFLQNWNITERGKENYKKYINSISVSGKGFIMPYGDSPFDKENVGEMVYMDVLNNARDYVHIMTPYLVLDNEMITCMEYAAKRGVDVKIILPHVTDNPSAYLIARNLYPQLIERGIKIYEYEPGFVHAKTVVSDDKKAVVGTINFDFRSLYLNMECAVYIQDDDEILEIEDDFEDTLSKCIEITMFDCERYSIVKRMLGKVASLVSPLM